MTTSEENPYAAPDAGETSRRAMSAAPASLSRGQLVGQTCHVCGKAIVSSAGASWCPACSLGFHDACLQVAGTCPSCEGDFQELNAALEAQESAEAAAEARRGQALVLLCIGIFLFVQVGSLAVSFFGGRLRDAASWGGFASAVVSVLFCSMLYFGYRWARIWLQVSLALSILVSGALLGKFLFAGREPEVLGAALQAGLMVTDGFVLYTISLSRSVSIFLGRQQS